MTTQAFDFYGEKESSEHQHEEGLAFTGSDWAECFEQAKTYAQSTRERWGAERVEIRDSESSETLAWVYSDSTKEV